MSGQVATRMTCFAVLSAVESDLRQLLRDIAVRTNKDEYLPPDVRSVAMTRKQTDRGNRSPEPDNTLLDYIDFSDIAKAISCLHKEAISASLDDPSWLVARLQELAPSRNRVCHSRPLEVEDLPTLLDFGKDIIQKYPSQDWLELRRTIERLEREPTFVLYTSIPEFWSSSLSKTHHNLPLPEFDDTGFVGRKQDRRVVEKYLRSTNPVVTILGEGGAGKTALALRCLYDLIDRKDSPYELIVWVSLKSKSLNAGGIQVIKSAISTTAGLVDAVFTELTGQTSSSENNKFSTIIEYLQTFKTLLAIDNLETLPAEQIRDLYLNVPHGSKILITSRIGIGEAEVRYPLGPLSTDDSIILFRSFSRFLNKPDLSQAPTSVIEKYCENLHRNPLLIKWFISSVAAGEDPKRILFGKAGSLESAIRFCFENLYAVLTKEQKLILEVLSCAGRPVAEPELRYLLRGRVEGDILQWALNLLHQSSMLRTELEPIRVSGDAISKHSLSDIAAQYINRVAKPTKALHTEVHKTLAELRWLEQEESVRKTAYKYDLFVVHCPNRYDRVAARDLTQALRYMRDQDFENAANSVTSARSLSPGFSEVDRIAAMLASERGDSYLAEQLYSSALEKDLQSGISLYAYAGFLLRSDRYEEGLEIIDKALTLDQGNIILLTRRAVFLVRLGKYADAADIYGHILESDPPYKKWRIATIREASECYRRWGETFSVRQDFDAARDKLDKSIVILQKLSAQELREDKTIRQTWKLVSDALYLLSSRDVTWSDRTVAWIRECIDAYGRPREELRGIHSAIRALTGTPLAGELSTLFSYASSSVSSIVIRSEPGEEHTKAR